MKREVIMIVQRNGIAKPQNLILTIHGGTFSWEASLPRGEIFLALKHVIEKPYSVRAVMFWTRHI